MTPERNLIEAVLEAMMVLHAQDTADAILTNPAVQAALAKVRGGADLAAFGASEAAGYLYPGEDQLPERLAYCQGAADGIATPKPEPVLRWEGDELFLGEWRVYRSFRGLARSWWIDNLLTGETSLFPTLTEARTAAEQAVRDWLKRAGCV